MIDIDKLDKMQADKNGGRGVNCVRAIVIYLRAGDEQSARTVASVETDKIRTYDDIYDYLVSCGLIKEVDWAFLMKKPV